MVEKFDVLNSKGEKTGHSIERKIVHAHGLWHATAHVWVFNSKGQVLLQKRAKNKDSHPDLWDISAAGHINTGSNPEKTALRELKEELGISAKAKELKKITVLKRTSKPHPSFFNKEFEHVFLMKFDKPISKIKVQKKEIQKVKFVSLEKLEKEIKNKKNYKNYVPHGKYWFGMIRAIAKELSKAQGK